MIETFEYIENYFCNRMSDEERQDFEKRCETDTAFAEVLAFYIATRDALKTEVVTQRRKDFEELYQTLSKQRRNKPLLIQLVPYLSAAAACFVLFFGWLMFFKNPTSEQLADQYIQENLQTLSVTMGGEKDSLAQGVDAFNHKNYKLSENMFILLSARPQTRPEAVKNLGFVYLQTGKFDLAALEFDTLAKMTDLYANPGVFYKALALIKRSKPGDDVQSKKLLEEVIRKKLPGYKEAQKWIETN